MPRLSFSIRLRALQAGLLSTLESTDFYEPLCQMILPFSSPQRQFNSRDPDIFRNIKDFSVEKGDYKVSEVEVKWPPTNDLIYKFWNSAKALFSLSSEGLYQKTLWARLRKVFVESSDIFGSLIISQIFKSLANKN